MQKLQRIEVRVERLLALKVGVSSIASFLEIPEARVYAIAKRLNRRG